MLGLGRRKHLSTGLAGLRMLLHDPRHRPHACPALVHPVLRGLCDRHPPSPGHDLIRTPEAEAPLRSLKLENGWLGGLGILKLHVIDEQHTTSLLICLFGEVEQMSFTLIPSRQDQKPRLPPLEHALLRLLLNPPHLQTNLPDLLHRSDWHIRVCRRHHFLRPSSKLQNITIPAAKLTKSIEDSFYSPRGTPISTTGTKIL
mmetsp:Transcript_53104/g.125449  ORF Transcript_53104/g.125449 Transcript_53104/m.125449 type:complete len:201 (+) Transcript_53104:923-1525(+)